MMNRLHGIVFAYRSNPDLRELTQHRNTSSLPFGGRYRVIDFMLSNMINAGVADVGLIAHANYQSLLDHVGSGKDWDLSRKHGGLRILPPFSFASKGDGIYRGRMDALAGVRSYLQNIRQEHVVLAWGDMAINFPLREMLETHLKSNADITAACTNIYRANPQRTDYLTLNEEGYITDVAIQPHAPQGAESLEIYIMSKALLLSIVDHCTAHNLHSFTQSILQDSANYGLRIKSFLFDGYAARLQSLAGYFARSMDLLDPDVRAQLFSPARPVKTKDQSNPSTYYGPNSKSNNSLIADGCIIEGEVENSILFRGVRVEAGAKVSNCILFQGATIQAGAVLNCAIADKNVLVSAGRMLMGHSTYPLAIAKNEII